MIEHSLNSRKVANMIQRSPAFEFHGCQISKVLREFGEKIKIAGDSLKQMYGKGSEVYESFGIEIERMVTRLNLKGYYKHDDAMYFKDILDRLMTKIKEFKVSVEKTQISMQDVGEIKHNNEGNIEDGLKGAAEDFIKNGNGDSSYFIDITKARNELEIVNNIFDHLNIIVVHLDKMKNVLKSYEDNLIYASIELNGIRKDDKFTVTNEDLKYLRLTIDNLKERSYKFIQKSF